MVETAQIKDHQFPVKVKALRDSRIRVDGIKQDFKEWDIVTIPYSNVDYFRMNGWAVVETTDASNGEEVKAREEVAKKNAKAAKKAD